MAGWLVVAGGSDEQAGRAARASARLRALRRRAPAEVPVDPQQEPVRLPEPEEREAYLVLDFALRAGEVLLSGGAGASDVTATTVALTGACGLGRVECDITFTSITLVYVRAPDVAPVTSLRLVRRRALDYTRVTEVHNLVEDLIAGRTDRATAMRRLDEVRGSRHPYRSWAVSVARAVLAAAVVVLLGGGGLVTLAAFASTVVVDRVNLRLGARQVPLFYQQVVGGALATSVALALYAGDLVTRPSLVVAGGIILLLPGAQLVGAVQDAITGFLVTASARAFEVLLLTAGIVAGVALALDVGQRLGVDVEIARASGSGLRDVPVQVVAAGIASGASAFSDYAPRRTVPTAGLAGGLGYAALLLLRELDLSGTLASGAAAVVVGFGAYTLAHRQQAPPLVYLAAGIIPLLPGLTIYRGMLRFADGDTVGGLAFLGDALTTGLALAAGAILGEFLAQPVRRDVRRHERPLAGPRLAGPALPSLRHHRRRDGSGRAPDPADPAAPGPVG